VSLTLVFGAHHGYSLDPGLVNEHTDVPVTGRRIGRNRELASDMGRVRRGASSCMPSFQPFAAAACARSPCVSSGSGVFTADVVALDRYRVTDGSPLLAMTDVSYIDYLVAPRGQTVQTLREVSQVSP